MHTSCACNYYVQLPCAGLSNWLSFVQQKEYFGQTEFAEAWDKSNCFWDEWVLF